MARNNQAITTAAQGASNALNRFEATESFARQLFRPDAGQSLRAVLTSDNLHVVMTDKHGTVLEVSNGQAAIAVADSEG